MAFHSSIYKENSQAVRKELTDRRKSMKQVDMQQRQSSASQNEKQQEA